MNETESGLRFFKGMLVAIPISILMWWIFGKWLMYLMN